MNDVEHTMDDEFSLIMSFAKNGENPLDDSYSFADNQLTDRPSFLQNQDVTRILDNRFSIKCKSVSPPRDNRKLPESAQKSSREDNTSFYTADKRYQDSQRVTVKLDSLNTTKETQRTENNFGFGKREDYYSTAKENINGTYRKLASAETEKSFVERQNVELHSQVKDLKEEIANLNKQARNVTQFQISERKFPSATESKLEKENRALREQIIALEKQFSQRKESPMNAQFNYLSSVSTTDNRLLSKIQNEKDNRIAELNQKLKEYETKVYSLETKLREAELDRMMKKRDFSPSTKYENIGSLSGSIARVNELETQLKHRETTIKELNLKIDRLEKLNEHDYGFQRDHSPQNRQTLERLILECKSLKEENKNLCESNLKLKNINANLEAMIQQKTSQQEKILSQANNEISNLKEQIKALQKGNKVEKDDRVSESKDQLNQARKIIDDYKKNFELILAEKERLICKLEDENKKAKLATIELQNQIKEFESLLAGKNQQTIELKQEIAELKKLQIAEDQVQNTKKEEEMSTIKECYEQIARKLQDEKRGLEAKLDELKRAYEGASEQIKCYSTESETLNLRIIKLEYENKKLQSFIEDYEEKIKIASSELAKAQQAWLDSEGDKESTVKILKETQNRVKTLTQEMSLMSDELIKARTNLSTVLNAVITTGQSELLEELEGIISLEST